MANRKGTRSHLARFCFLRDDENLRLTIKFMIEQTGRTKWSISQEVGIPNYRMSQYLAGIKTNRLSQFQVMLLCEYFNIEPELKVTYNE